MDDIDYGPYDVLTGHAGARFRWIDVRSDPDRESAPVQYTHYALPLERLLAGERLPYDGDTPLAVFGRDSTTRHVQPIFWSARGIGTSFRSLGNATAAMTGSSIRT